MSKGTLDRTMPLVTVRALDHGLALERTFLQLIPLRWIQRARWKVDRRCRHPRVAGPRVWPM